MNNHLEITERLQVAVQQAANTGPVPTILEVQKLKNNNIRFRCETEEAQRLRLSSTHENFSLSFDLALCQTRPLPVLSCTSWFSVAMRRKHMDDLERGLGRCI